MSGMSGMNGYVVVALLAAFVAVGDYFIKLASLETDPISNHWFWVGFAIYGASTFGWVYAMPHLKLATLGILFSLVTVLLLAGIGVGVFGETLNRYELVGLALGVVSMILLARVGG
jgi:small multidrug resistance pump